MSGYILTAKGRRFYFDRPEEFVYDIEEGAHALSHICRFTGHVKEFYSVAQHAVLVSLLVPKPLAWAGLHHDDSESLLNDISSPLKALLPDYKRYEHRTEQMIFAQLGIPFPLPPAIKHADLRMLVTEMRDLMTPEQEASALLHLGLPSIPNVEPIRAIIHPLPPRQAKALYLARCEQLQKERPRG